MWFKFVKFVNEVPWQQCSSFLTDFFINSDQRACKKVQFKSAVSNKALEGHKLTTHRVVSEDICQIKCVSHERCSSYNLGPPSDHGLRDCDLSSSDTIRHPNDLTTHNGYIYRETRVCTSKKTNVPVITFHWIY